MTTLTLAADPILPWGTLLSPANQFRPRSQGDTYVILDGTVSGLPATIEYYGTGFGADGGGFRNGAATVNTYRYTVGGQVAVLQEGAGVTGQPLLAWLGGDGAAFNQAAFRGDDLILASNLADNLFAYGGNDRIDGRGGDDTLLGGAGNDTLIGGAGNNRLEGGDGDDLSMSGAGDRDTMHGGAGIDTFIASHTLRGEAEISASASELTLSNPYPMAPDTLIAVERIAFLDGVLHLDPAGAAGQVWRLYGAALGRGAEATGLSGWVGALEAGAVSVTDVARSFVGSAEFAQRHGQLDDAGFVSRLYANVLGRAPDSAGLEGWTAKLANGASRAEVLLGFSESAEYRAAVDPGIANRLWTVDPEAVEVVRCYMTVLDRRPDAMGLSVWILQRNNGLLTEAEMADAFMRSPEFQSRFGGLSNGDFVDRLYLSALDRPADAAGRADWTAKLDSGAVGRRDVVQGFAYSEEMTQELLPLVADGIAFA